MFDEFIATMGCLNKRWFSIRIPHPLGCRKSLQVRRKRAAAGVWRWTCSGLVGGFSWKERENFRTFSGNVDFVSEVLREGFFLMYYFEGNSQFAGENKEKNGASWRFWFARYSFLQSFWTGEIPCPCIIKQDRLIGLIGGFEQFCVCCDSCQANSWKLCVE